MKTPKLLSFAFIALFIGSPFYPAAQVLPQDSLALVAFYNSTGGPNWTNNTGWLTGPVSSWYGVTVEGNRVTYLGSPGNFAFNNLNGQIPSDIGYLTGLKGLFIGNNPNLGGFIPDEIGNLQQLIGLGIGNCSLSGTIPNTIGNCSLLEFINIWENNLSGSIPPEIGNIDSLLFIDLHDNQITGPIPPELGNCTQLLELRLNNNQLSGTIPEALAICNQIQILDLSNNQLVGEVPYEVAGVSSYQFMYLNNNHLTGIPHWNNNWFLNVLDIGGNCMTFEDLEPHFVGYMWYNYYPQDSMQTVIDTLLPNGSNFNIYSGSLGQYTTYYWFHNGVHIPGTENADTLKLINISEADVGTYTCQAQSSICKEPNGMPMVLCRRPVTFGITVGVDDLPTHNHLSVYPNPCTDNLNIETTAVFHDGLLQLVNIFGQLLKSEPWPRSSSSHTLNIDNLPFGIYLLTLQDKKHFFKKKIVKN